MTARVAGDPGLVEAVRARRSKGKEPIERDAMQDGRLSMKARGILGFLCSKPDKWRTNAQSIANTCDRDGRDSITAGLKELEEKGYLARRKRHGAGGKFMWVWIYSDDPGEVADVLTVMFPEDGVPPSQAARRGRARKPPASDVPAGHTMNGKPVDGQAADGATVDGFAVDGKPVDIEIQEKEIPPNPPQSGGDDESSAEDPRPAGRPVCPEHGIAGCRACGLSVRSQAHAERQRTAAEILARERAGRACVMCKADGPRSDGQGTRWTRVIPGTQLVLTPYVPCDHETPHQQIAERLAADDALRAAPGASEPDPVASEAARAAARALVARSCKPARPQPKRDGPGRRPRAALKREPVAA